MVFTINNIVEKNTGTEILWSTDENGVAVFTIYTLDRKQFLFLSSLNLNDRHGTIFVGVTLPENYEMYIESGTEKRKLDKIIPVVRPPTPEPVRLPQEEYVRDPIPDRIERLVDPVPFYFDQRAFDRLIQPIPPLAPRVQIRRIQRSAGDEFSWFSIIFSFVIISTIFFVSSFLASPGVFAPKKTDFSKNILV
jgi:hypothetical protein